MDATRIKKANELLNEELEYMNTGSDAQDGEFCGMLLALMLILEDMVRAYDQENWSA